MRRGIGLMAEWARDERLAGLQVYRVGGAIRDELLGPARFATNCLA